MCKDKTNKEETKSRLWIWIVVAIIGVLAAWGLSWWLINKNIDCSTERGTFGDMFGAVNALFSGLAFAGLIATLLYQREELKLQRKELNEQKLEFREQNKTLKRQRFENTFFNMLSLQQEIVANISFDEVKTIIDFNAHTQDKQRTSYNGRSLFREMYLNLKVSIDKKQFYQGVKGAIQANNYSAYSYISATTRFDHYFRHLYRIFKYVDTSDLIPSNERYEYACIVRSQLSDYELVMLFYNCLTSNGRAKFKPLIEKYSIFNNLREDLLAKKEHKKEYSEKAYDRYAE